MNVGGKHSDDSGKWDCNGRCGPGCGTWACSNWARDCLKHDVCGWYFEATGGSSNQDCGDEFDEAIWDTATPCSSSTCRGDQSSCSK